MSICRTCGDRLPENTHAKTFRYRRGKESGVFCVECTVIRNRKDNIVLRETGAAVLARRPASVDVGDNYLEIVLCDTKTGSPQRYATWLHNVECRSIGNGHYHDTLEDAQLDFYERKI